MKAGKIVLVALLAGMLASCGGNKEEQQAQARLTVAQTMVDEGQWETAKVELDSIHILYRQQVAVRRRAKALQDSIVYLEAQRTLAYSDSVLQVLLPQVDPLLKKFRYEKSDKYESNGQYVSRLLQTERNMERCYVQAYVGDNRVTRVKSYYYGASPLLQESLSLEVRTEGEPLRVEVTGTNHAFEADGYYSILTTEGEDAIRLLGFIAEHATERIRVRLTGTNGKGKAATYTYYLQETEKKALAETLQLAVMFHDIQRLEDAIRLASAQIVRYESRGNAAIAD